MLDYEKLDVYQCSIQFFTLAAKLVTKLPRGHNHLADQMKRASLSILLNIAEGAGKMTAADQQRFYGIARGSAMESGAILDAMRGLEVADNDSLDEAKRQVVRIVSMLSKMCGLGRKPKRKRET